MGMSCKTKRSPSPLTHEPDSQSVVPTHWADPRPACVADVMAWNISVVSPQVMLGEALHLFRMLDLQIMAVYDGKTYLGVVEYSTLQDAMRSGFRHQPHARVREVMDTDSRPCSPDDSLCDAWHRMQSQSRMHLPVVDVMGKLVGVLSSAIVKERFPILAVTESERRPEVVSTGTASGRSYADDSLWGEQELKETHH